MSLPSASYGYRPKYFEPLLWKYIKIYLNFGTSRNSVSIISSLMYEFHIPYYLKLISKITTLVTLKITNLFVFCYNKKFFKIFLWCTWWLGGSYLGLDLREIHSTIRSLWFGFHVERPSSFLLFRQGLVTGMFLWGSDRSLVHCHFG